ncbi:MAG: AIR synthase-related protein, partial [Methanobacteriota archaeon]
NHGAKLANVTVIGGEVAVVPEIVRGYDLAGACFGIVEKRKIVDGRAIRPGDVILGVPSTGIHSNGLTLARRVLRDSALTVFDKVGGVGGPWGPALLEPTAIYVRPVLRALRRARVHGMAHITGGGLRNLVRLKPNVRFRITDPLEPPLVFRELQALGGIEDGEMYRTFNMGMGFALVVPAAAAPEVIRVLRPDARAKIVGDVVKGRGVALEPLGLSWETY